MKIGRKIIIGALRILVILFLLLILIRLLIQVPRIQTSLVQYITQDLSDRFDTRIQVNKVDLRLFKTGVLKDIIIEDTLGRPLLACDEISFSLEIFSLFRKQIDFSKISFKSPVINIYTHSESGRFNYEFLIRKKESPKPASWKIGLGALKLDNLDFSYEVPHQNISLISRDNYIKIEANQLNNEIINLKKVIFSGGELDYFSTQANPKQDPSIRSLSFPDPGIDISIEDLKIDDLHFHKILSE